MVMIALVLTVAAFTTSVKAFSNTSINFTNWQNINGTIPSAISIRIGYNLDGAFSSSDSLIAYYPFDENAGGTIIDYSGKGYNATITNNQYNPDYGYSGGATWFNGSPMIRTPLNMSPAFIGPNITIMIWVNWTNCNTTGQAFWGSDGGQPDRFYFYVRAPNSTVIGLSNWQSTILNTMPTPGWYHMVITINESTGKFYLNGKLNTTTNSYFWNLSNKTLQIGSAENGLKFNGTLDEFRMWNRTLSEAEISAWYNNSCNQNPIYNCMQLNTAQYIYNLTNPMQLSNLTWNYQGSDPHQNVTFNLSVSNDGVVWTDTQQCTNNASCVFDVGMHGSLVKAVVTMVTDSALYAAALTSVSLSYDSLDDFTSYPVCTPEVLTYDMPCVVPIKTSDNCLSLSAQLLNDSGIIENMHIGSLNSVYNCGALVNFTTSGNYYVNASNGVTDYFKIVEDKTMLGMIILLPLIFGGFLIGASFLLKEPDFDLLKILLFLSSMPLFYLSYHSATLALIKYYNFPEMVSQIEWISNIVIGITFLILIYFVVTIVMRSVKATMARKREIFGEQN